MKKLPTKKGTRLKDTRLKGARLIVLALLILAIILTFTGCSSLSAIVKSSFSGLPYWIYGPQVGLDSSKTAFVGQGKASTERQAELFAYSDLLAQLSSSLGVELGQEQYRELSVLGTISDYNLFVNDSYSAFQDGEVVAYVHAVADKKLLEEASTEEMKRRNENASNVEALILKGDEYVKDGQDLKGLSCYLESMVLSYEQDYIKEEYSYYTILEDVKKLLDSLTVSIVSQNQTLAECTVQVRRKSVLIASRVEGAEIKASYQAIDVTGQLYDDSFIYSTDSNGEISFSPLNFTMVRTGAVTFSFDLDAELATLENTDPQVVAQLKALVKSKTVTFEYDREYGLGSIAVTVLEHDENGYVTGNTVTADYLVFCLEADGAQAVSYYALSDQEEDVLYDYVQTKGSCDCLLVCRFGREETIQSTNGIFVVVEGTATLYSTNLNSKDRVLYESGIVYAIGSGQKVETATEQAYIKLADIVHSLLKDVYV